MWRKRIAECLDSKIETENVGVEMLMLLDQNPPRLHYLDNSIEEQMVSAFGAMNVGAEMLMLLDQNPPLLHYPDNSIEA